MSIMTRVFLIIIFGTRLTNAADFTSTARAVFRTPNGASVSLEQIGLSRPTFLLFWADWCTPCKVELNAIAQNAQAWSQFEMIAVNIDSLNDRSAVETSLQSLKWPFSSWYDEGGKVFETVQESGDLPFALLFSAHSVFIEKMNSVDERQIPLYEKLIKESTPRAGKFRVNNFFQTQTLRKNHRDEADVQANITTLGWDHSEFNIQAEGYSIHQGRPPGVPTPWESELGRSFIKWRGLTVGDQSVHLQHGIVFSARPNALSNQNSSVLGAGHRATWDGAQLNIFAGRVRDMLFPFQINPAQDLTRLAPQEWAAGFDYEFSFVPGTKAVNSASSDASRVNLGFAFATYAREADPNLGFFAPSRDLRVALPVRAQSSSFDFFLTPALYRNLEVTGDQLSGEALMTYKHSPTLSLPLALQWARADQPRTFFATFLEAPALPLGVDRKRSVNLGFYKSFLSTDFKINLVAEKGIENYAADQQGTVMLTHSAKQGSWKIHAVYQDRDLQTINARENETFLDGEFITNEIFNWGVLAKRHSSPAHSNEVHAGIHVLPLFNLNTNKTWSLNDISLSTVLTEQNGSYYHGYSGLAASRLSSVQLKIDFKNWNVLAAAGQQAGGLQCSGGACTQIPPLDGWRASVSTHFDL